MTPEQPDTIAILRQSREFVEQQMQLFIGKLLRCRIAGVGEGKPRLNFGPFSIPFENQADFRDGDIATFRVIALTNSLITLGLVRREGAASPPEGESSLGEKTASLLSELKFPVDEENLTAVRDLLKAGFAATRENIRAAVVLKADPNDEGVASQVLRGLLMKGADIPPALLRALSDYLGSVQEEDILPENGIRNPSPEKLLQAADKFLRVRGQDGVAAEAQAITRRILPALKALQLSAVEESPASYTAVASKRIGSETALARAFNAFIPKFVSSLHPNDPLRAVFREFAAAVEQKIAPAQIPGAAQMPIGDGKPLPIEILPALINFIQSDPTLAESLKDLIAGFVAYIRHTITPETTVDTEIPTGAGARQLQANVSLNLGRLIAIADEAAKESAAAPVREASTALRDSAEAVMSKTDGMRAADWLLTPARPSPDNLPVVGFTLPEGARGSISLHPGVKRREDAEEETPAGGRLVFEGEGIGRVDISLEYGEEGLSALFVTRLKDTHADIQAGLPELSGNLDARGVKVRSLRSILRVAKEARSTKTAKDDLPTKGLDLKA